MLRSSTAILFILICGLLQAAEAEPFVLLQEGKPPAVIVANGHEEQAATLAEYLQRISGKEIAIVVADKDAPGGAPRIVLKTMNELPGVGNGATGRQAYRIAVTPKRISLESVTDKGLTYAVQGLLEDHLGCRFYAPGAEVVPERPDLALECFEDIQKPAFAIRGFIYYPSIHQNGWIIKNRGGGLPADEVASSHTFYNYLPPQTYFEEHPEWYPLRNGKRQQTWAMGLCYSNPEMAREFAEKVKASMAKRAAATEEERRKKASMDPANPLQIGQGDGFAACECETCRALVEKEGTEAAPIILMMNRILEETEKEYPDQSICTFAYFGTLTPPKTLQPHRNLWINVVSSALAPGPAGDQMGRIRDGLHNQDYREALKGWPKIAPGRVTTWDWSHWGPYYWPNLYATVDNINFWRDCDIAGGQFQVGWGGGNFAWLRNWLYLKLLWNPDADADGLIKDFLAGYYGEKAAPLMWDFLQFAESHGRESGHAGCLARWNYWPATLRQKLYDEPTAIRMDQILALAQDAAEAEGDPAYARRVVEARATSVDRILLDGMGPLARTPVLEDGTVWFVPEGSLDAVSIMRRDMDYLEKMPQYPGARRDRSLAGFGAKFGGPVLTAESDVLRLDVVPALKARPVALIHKPTGKVILSFADAPACRETVKHFSWCVRKAEGEERAIRTASHVEVGKWAWSREQLIEQDYILPKAGATLRVERHYRISHGAPLNGRFGMAWNVYLPDPEAARVIVRGGGIEQAFGLANAETGDIVGVVAEDADRERRDYQDPLLDTAKPVRTGETKTLDLSSDEGEVEVVVFRGDGLTIRLASPASGTKTVRVQPVADEYRVEVAFDGRPVAIGKPKGKQPFETDLPPVTLRVESSEAKPAVRTKINPIDGAEMVWVPADSFLLGSDAPGSQFGEHPERRIHLDGYWIYKTPVTCAMYKRYCEATGREMPKEFWGKALEGDLPMLGLNWYGAAAYAAWAGGALPSEAQWEKAARGNDGRAYPWGNEWDPERCWCHANTLYAGKPYPQPVGTRPSGASPYGLEDMAGNVWEFVADWYAPDAHARCSAINPAGPATGTHKVLKGGSWQWNRTYLRSAYREANPPQIDNWLWVSFRCVLTGE